MLTAACSAATQGVLGVEMHMAQSQGFDSQKCKRMEAVEAVQAGKDTPPPPLFCDTFTLAHLTKAAHFWWRVFFSYFPLGNPIAEFYCKRAGCRGVSFFHHKRILTRVPCEKINYIDL